MYRHGLWGNELRFSFPVAKLLDFRSRLPQLEQSTNPFALLTAATLHAQATRQYSKKRDAAKWRLVRGLYRVGLSKDQVLDLFKLIDWVLRLSPRQEEDFWLRLQEMERELRMPYITSVERIGMEKGLERGLEQGRTEGEAALRKMIQEILESRFQVVSTDVQDRLDSYSGLEGLRALGRLALTAESLDEFQERME